MIKYNLILADCPWAFRDKAAAGKRGAGFKYPLMDLESICAMRPMIDAIAADNCLLVFWWVDTMPVEALKVVEAWGFKLRKMNGLVWRKLTQDGRDAFGMGNWTRASVECALFATRGKAHGLVVNKGVRQIINEERHQHSQKPNQSFTHLEKLVGNVPRIELFSRSHRVGWSSWGLSINEDLNIIHSMDDHGDVTVHDIRPQFKEKKGRPKK